MLSDEKKIHFVQFETEDHSQSLVLAGEGPIWGFPLPFASIFYDQLVKTIKRARALLCIRKAGVRRGWS